MATNNIGIISVIPKTPDTSFHTMEGSLRQKGYSRAPGTFVFFFPAKELSNKYRTGLDPEAGYIKNIKDPEARAAEIKRVTDLRKRLERELEGVDLSPTSSYWKTLDPIKLSDGDNAFDLDNPMKAISFAWLSVHPTIASSLEAYNRGEYPSDTHFYVKNVDVQNTVSYKRNKLEVDSLIKFSSFDLTKRRKIGRLVGLPISEDMKEEVVYNAMVDFLREKEVKIGPYKNSDPITIFNRFADLTDNALYIKDLIEQVLNNQIYRVNKGGQVFEGETKMFTSKSDMVAFYMDDANQRELIELEEKLKLKMSIFA